MPARICLITPGHLSTNPRLVKEADALSAAGYEVTVIAASYLPWAAEADRTFASRPWRIAPPRPFGPHAPTGLRARQAVRQRLARVIASWSARGGADNLALARMALHPAAPDLSAAAMDLPADLYIAHYVAALPAAALAAKHHGGLYAFDAEDFHLGQFEPGRGERERRTIAAIEGAYIRDCAYVSAASPCIADAYAEIYGVARPKVILNVFPRAQAPTAATARGTATPGPSIYWVSQTIGPNRGLETAVRAIAKTRSRPHLYLRGAPATGYVERLQTIADEWGGKDSLHILSPEPPAEMERLAAAYDVGLSGEPGHTANNRYALGNKIFSCFLAGTPVLMSDVLAHRGFAPDCEGCIRLYTAEDPSSLAEAMDSLLTDPAVLAAARRRAFDLAQSRFNWDVEKDVLLEQVDRALRVRRRS